MRHSQWAHFAEKGKLRVAKKRVIGRYPKAFRKMAVERLKGCDNVVALSQELGVHRRLLYKWRDQLEPMEDGEGPPTNSRERELRQQVTQLKRASTTTSAFLPSTETRKTTPSWKSGRPTYPTKSGVFMRVILFTVATTADNRRFHVLTAGH